MVSDQLRTDALIVRPPWEKPSESIRVKGHGPAMHVTLALRNTLPSPASKDAEPMCALHLPSGEHGECLLHRNVAGIYDLKCFYSAADILR